MTVTISEDASGPEEEPKKSKKDKKKAEKPA